LADTSAWVWSRRRAYPELRHGFDTALVDGDDDRIAEITGQPTRWLAPRGSLR
jgi:hypothetical protein